MTLFGSEDLADFLQQDVTIEAAVSVERVVWGWLKPVLKLTERPDPVPDEVYSWAIELAAIAHENPAGLESYQLGGEQSRYSAERRRQILADASGSSSTAGGDGIPRGCFPPAQCWPDPVRQPQRWPYL